MNREICLHFPPIPEQGNANGINKKLEKYENDNLMYSISMINILKTQLEKAQKIYDEILTLQPKHFDALQIAGALALQTSQYDKAIILLSN
jgi:tetratricopeptide (TPR) repeat protein